jgi:hypothetical protein
MKMIISKMPTGNWILDDMIKNYQKWSSNNATFLKESFALNVAYTVSLSKGIPSAYFSLNVPDEHWIAHIKEDTLSHEKISLRGRMTYVDNSDELTISDFRTQTKKVVGEKGIKIVVIDCGHLKEYNTGIIDDSELSQTINDLATELSIVIIGLI